MRPNFLRPRLDDPFWAAAAALVAVVLAVEACRMIFTDRAAERERMELVRDGD